MSTKNELLMQSVFGILLLVSLWVQKKYGNSEFFLYGWIIFMIIQFTFHNRLEGIDDEFTKSILGKINSFCMTITMILLFFIGSTMVSPNPSFSNFFTDKYQTGLILLVYLVLITNLRLILFVYYNRKGITD